MAKTRASGQDRMKNLAGETRCESPNPHEPEHVCVRFLKDGERCPLHKCLRSDRYGQIYWMTWKAEREN